MPWFKVDDTLHGHPKARRAGLPALGLWTVAGSYSMSYKTDGFIPDWFVQSWPNGRKLAQQLVEADLWDIADTDEHGSAGWVAHDWDDYQPTAEEIEQDREANRERQKQWRQRRRKLKSVEDDTA